MDTDTKGDRTLDAAFIFAMLFLMGSAVFILGFHDIPKDNMPLFAALTSGTVGSSIGAYVGYRWGSSKGSQAKDDTIVQMASQTKDGQ